MKKKDARKQLIEEIKVENLTVSKFYYGYFPFKKSVSEEPVNTKLPLVVRQKKNAEHLFEIVDRVEIYEKALLDKKEKISCVIEKMNDAEVRLYSLEAALLSRTLSVMQAIVCRQEILRLGSQCSPANVIHLARKTSSATYQRAYESFVWFLAEARAKIFPNLSELTEIEFIAHCLNFADGKQIEDLNPFEKELLTDFQKVYLDNDAKIKINTFYRKYYKNSAAAEENRRIHPFKNSVWKRKAKKIVETLIISSTEFVALLQQEGKKNLADELMKSLMDDKNKVSAIASLSREFIKITTALSKDEGVVENPLLFSE